MSLLWPVGPLKYLLTLTRGTLRVWDPLTQWGCPLPQWPSPAQMPQAHLSPCFPSAPPALVLQHPCLPFPEHKQTRPLVSLLPETLPTVQSPHSTHTSCKSDHPIPLLRICHGFLPSFRGKQAPTGAGRCELRAPLCPQGRPGSTHGTAPGRPPSPDLTVHQHGPSVTFSMTLISAFLCFSVFALTCLHSLKASLCTINRT